MCKIGETHPVGSTVVLPWCQGSSGSAHQVSYILKKWVVGKNSIDIWLNLWPFWWGDSAWFLGQGVYVAWPSWKINLIFQMSPTLTCLSWKFIYMHENNQSLFSALQIGKPKYQTQRRKKRRRKSDGFFVVIKSDQIMGIESVFYHSPKLWVNIAYAPTFIPQILIFYFFYFLISWFEQSACFASTFMSK